MKGGTVQINWHDTKPILTLDFHPLSGILATGGADCDIKVSNFPMYTFCSFRHFKNLEIGLVRLLVARSFARVFIS